MELIKENKEKHRAVFKLNNTTIRKHWYNNSSEWLEDHVKILNQIFPGYVVNYGSLIPGGVYADFKKIEGVSASTFPHTDEFVERIYNFCLENIKSTSPYVHGDWVLSNIIINGNEIKMCDWDNVSIRTDAEVSKKLEKDLISAFGEKILKVLK